MSKEIPVPTEADVSASMNLLTDRGLPEEETCSLAALGFTSAEIDEVEQVTKDSPDEYFYGLADAGLALSPIGNAAAQLARGDLKPAVGSDIAIADIHPRVLQGRSKGRWITVYLELPDSHRLLDVNCDSLRLFTELAPDQCGDVGDYDEDGESDLALKFERAEVIRLLRAGRNVIPIVGWLTDGTLVGGTDMIEFIP